MNLYDENNSLNIWCCESRNSDNIMVVTSEEKDHLNMFNDNAWENARYFKANDYDTAINYAYKAIKLSFGTKMKETNFSFKLYEDLEKLKKINVDDISENICFASYIDDFEKMFCDLDIRDNEWCLSLHEIISSDKYGDIIDIKIEPNFESETLLMLQMQKFLNDFLKQELEYKLNNCKSII